MNPFKGLEDAAPERTELTPGPAFVDRVNTLFNERSWNEIVDGNDFQAFLIRAKQLNIVILDMDGI